ncbi:hypothetical protein [Arenibacter hampyeongensis]|nr:hypothetical protein [Arenibacter hampyeongensis]
MNNPKMEISLKEAGLEIADQITPTNNGSYVYGNHFRPMKYIQNNNFKINLMSINTKFLVIFIFLFISSFALNAQKVAGFYDEHFNFEYPSMPMPFGVFFYQVNYSVKTQGIKAYDSRNELVNIQALNPKLVEYSNDYTVRLGKLSSFVEVNENGSNPNTVQFSLNSSDIILSHEQSEVDTIYNINAKAKAYINVSHNEKIIYQDSIFYDDIVSEIYSDLSPSKFDQQAINLYEGMTVDANNKVLSHFFNTYHRFVRKIDMGYFKDDVPFFKMNKTKKLTDPEKVDELEKRIRALTDIDEGFESREIRNIEIKSLITDFESEMNNSDYKNHDTYKAFISGNLGSLYSLIEEFDAALDNYEKAKGLIDKGGAGSYAQHGIRDNERRKKLRANIIKDQKVLIEYADNYDKVLNTGSK